MVSSKPMGSKRQIGIGVVISALALLWWGSATMVRPLPSSLSPSARPTDKRKVVDRSGRPLSYTFASQFNVSDEKPLHEIPLLLRQAFIEAEDHRFFDHSGVDWRARLHAVWQNLWALRIVRGASTITEQVVGMIHPRSRSVWSRYIEGIEASRLEARFSKGEILEFYLNQVPFAANRRGVVQAARYFWDRDLETLNEREQLGLAVMVRAPARFDLYRDPRVLDRAIGDLAHRMRLGGIITAETEQAISTQVFTLGKGSLPVRADHFARYVQSVATNVRADTIHSTIDAPLQQTVQKILERRVAELSSKGVSDGAAIVVDNRSGEVLAWVNAGAFGNDEGSQIDAVITPRQPGSTLKPFLYALALSGDWTPATLINDSPLVEAVGTGAHSYRNYSRMHYGEISLRDALGNSLNIPAIKTAQHVGKHRFLEFLHRVGFSSLTKPVDFYGDGLALGNGEVTLFELAQGYLSLANRGVWRPLRVVRNSDELTKRHEAPGLVSPEVASMIGSILSDPLARRLEFGSDGLFRFPVQTAIKTGTSTDYRDAWALGYTEQFTVGVWLGNLNRTSMHEISGARGPTLVLRGIFAELNRRGETTALFLSPTLLHRAVCPASGLLATEGCSKVDEIFVSGSEPTHECARHNGRSDADPRVGASGTATRARIIMPTPGLNVARDPRIPDDREALPFELDSVKGVSRVRWFVDEREVGVTTRSPHHFPWALEVGHHTVRAEVMYSTQAPASLTEPVGFWVR